MKFRPPTGASTIVRGSGITTAITFPTRGIFGGQGSAIDLVTAEKSGQMVVESPVGQYISLGRGGFGGGMGGGYPGALMGMIAYVRQVYLDAAHYKLVKDAYAKNPRGMERPQYDRALEGVLDSKRILLPAQPPGRDRPHDPLRGRAEAAGGALRHARRLPRRRRPSC